MKKQVWILAFAFLSACQQQNPQTTESSGTSARDVPSASVDAEKRPELSESKFRSGMAVEDVKKLIFKDENGKDITFNQFKSVVTSGRSFAKTVPADKSVAIFTINAAKGPALSNTPRPVKLKFAIASIFPEIGAPDLTGKKYKLNNGKHYTLLSFFFADCVPCIQEVPILNTLSDKRNDIDVISLTFDDKNTAQAFVKKRHLEVPVIYGQKTYIDAVGVKTYPTLVLISPEGRLVGARTSYEAAATPEAASQELQQWLESLGVGT